jgi:hypothetical protein
MSAEGPKERKIKASNVRDTQTGNNNSAAQSACATTPNGRKTNSWLLEISCIFFSALSIVGMSILLWHYDAMPSPSWSFAFHRSLNGKSRHVTFNSILDLFSTASRIALALPLTKALGQLAWVWFTKHTRQLADFAVFDQAAKQSPIGSAKLIWRLKGR